MQFKVILFDIDGTLVNSFPHYVAIMEKLLPLYGVKPTKKIFITTFPKTIDQTLVELGLPLSQKNSVLKQYFSIDQELQIKEVLYPGVQSELVQLIKRPNLKLGIVTSRSKNEVQSLFKQIPILNTMNIVVSADSVSEHKPSPMPINFALKQLNIEPKSTLYIGDAKTDYQAAKAANVKFAAAMWGTNEKNSFGQNIIKLNYPSEISQIIKN